MASHIVKRQTDLVFDKPEEFHDRSLGYATASVVDEPAGGVQMGFRVARLEPEGEVASHVHSFEESLFVIEGSLVADTAEGSVELSEGDYGLFPVATTHGFRNLGGQTAVFAEMKAPLPRRRFGFDTMFPRPIVPGAPQPIDVRDPRTRAFGHISAASMDPSLQTQNRLAVSASMRTALLLYSGITVK
ncbi:MAG: cupin domain-containing protein, partial [Acidimicrobiia bacterium]